MSHKEADLPPRIMEAFKALWEAEFGTEAQAFDSGRFRMLRHICSSIYPETPGSRLPVAAASDIARGKLHEALCNFFRWTGAPWYREKTCITAENAAIQLHAAFLLSEVQRTYLAPLDQLGLGDTAKRPYGDFRRISFGNCEIVLLDGDNLPQYVPINALRRFEKRHWFQSERFAGFYYLAVSTKESAGPIWQRGRWPIPPQLSLDEIGQIKLYKTVYAEPVESALFTMLLCFIEDPLKEQGKPFAIPWVYSLTKDPFSEPPLAPDASSLSWRIAGDEDDQYEEPDRSNYFAFAQEEIEKALGQRWNRLQAALTRSDDASANFHPLTKHFFVKTFREGGADEIVALISCIEATLMLPKERSEKLKKRYKKLVNHETAHEWLKCAYDLRNRYLHSLGDQQDTTSWEDLAKYRWAVGRAVDDYLTLTETRSGDNREALLRSLKR